MSNHAIKYVHTQIYCFCNYNLVSLLANGHITVGFGFGFGFDATGWVCYPQVSGLTPGQGVAALRTFLATMFTLLCPCNQAI